MADLQKIAERAKTDATRAEHLRIVLETLAEHTSTNMVRGEIEFIRSDRGYLAGPAVWEVIKRHWPSIREEAVREATAELEEIEKRYASLLVDEEARSDG